MENCAHAHPNEPAWKNAVISNRRSVRHRERSPAASTSSREMNISKRQPSVQKEAARIPQGWGLGENTDTGWGNSGEYTNSSWTSPKNQQTTTSRAWGTPSLSSTFAQAPPSKSPSASSPSYRPPPPPPPPPPSPPPSLPSVPPPRTETFGPRSSPPRGHRNQSTSSDGNKVIASTRNISSAQDEIGFRIK